MALTSRSGWSLGIRTEPCLWVPLQISKQMMSMSTGSLQPQSSVVVSVSLNRYKIP